MIQGQEQKFIAEMQRLHLPFRYNQLIYKIYISERKHSFVCEVYLSFPNRFYQEMSIDGKVGKLKWNTLNIHQLDTVLESFKISNVLNSEYDRRKTKIDNLTKQQLLDELKNLGINEKGKKDYLVSRLKEKLGAHAMVNV